MQRGVERCCNCQAGWLTFPVSLFFKDWVIRLGDCDCAAAAADTSEQVWEPATETHDTPHTSRTDRRARRRGYFTADKEARRREASPKDPKDGGLELITAGGGLGVV